MATSLRFEVAPVIYPAGEYEDWCIGGTFTASSPFKRWHGVIYLNDFALDWVIMDGPIGEDGALSRLVDYYEWVY